MRVLLSSRRTVVARAVPLTFLAAILAGAALADAMAQAPELDSAFGFEVGEERAYKLGPVDAVFAGEAAEWRIWLERLEQVDGQYLATFNFTHERYEGIPGSQDPTRGLMNVSVQGRLRTNLAGFPLMVQYQQEFSILGEEVYGNGRRIIRFDYDADRKRFDKGVKVGKRDFDFHFAVPKYEYLDPSVPRGAYVYMPGALDCLGTSQVTCVELEPAFANPGLLSLMMSTLSEVEEDEREFLFFMPASLSASPFNQVMAGPWLSRERNNIASMKRYFDFMKVKLGPSVEIEVGPRTLHAWEIDMCCGIDRIYVRPDGTVLRVDLEGTMHNSPDRWIRYVFPSEEFSTNEDPEIR